MNIEATLRAGAKRVPRNAVLFLLPGCGAVLAHARDRCEGWQHPRFPVLMEACSYEDGGSGYYQVTNTGTRTATVCWQVELNNGKALRRCHSQLGPGEQSSGSCASCGSRNGGAREITLEKYELK